MRVVVRRATLSLDSDLEPDADLLIRAAQAAIWLADLPSPIGWRRRRRAPAADRRPSSSAHMRCRGSIEGKKPKRCSRCSRRRVNRRRPRQIHVPAGEQHAVGAGRPGAGERAHRRCFAHHRRAGAQLDRRAPDRVLVRHGPAGCREAGFRQNFTLADLPAIIGSETAWALAAIAADAGRTAEALAIADVGYSLATRSSDAPHMRFNIADAHISALMLAGRVGDALEVAERERRQAADLPGAAQLLGAAMAGRAALGAGRLDTACSLLEQAAGALSASGHAIGWGYRYQHSPHERACHAWSTDEAAAALSAIGKLRRPFRSLDYERGLARAWVAAGQGAVSEAITILRSAAETAAASGRFAAEVICLQTATQFGDRSAASRLRELEAMVEGPRVGCAARFAAALRDSDAAELVSVSTDFERMGDLVAAVDAAAQAAIAYRNQDLRGSALGCVARAEALADNAEVPILPLFVRPASRCH